MWKPRMRVETYSVVGLVSPKFPDVVKPKRFLRDADTAPNAEQKDPECIL
jgi:hypothetical protein